MGCAPRRDSAANPRPAPTLPAEGSEPPAPRRRGRANRDRPGAGELDPGESASRRPAGPERLFARAAVVVALAPSWQARPAAASLRRAAGSGRPDSLAVLPFKDLSRQPDGQLLGDAFAETMSARLASMPGLQVVTPTAVVARAAERDREPESPASRRPSEPTLILHGTFQRERDRIRITYAPRGEHGHSPVGGDRHSRRHRLRPLPPAGPPRGKRFAPGPEAPAPRPRVTARDPARTRGRRCAGAIRPGDRLSPALRPAELPSTRPRGFARGPRAGESVVGDRARRPRTGVPGATST